MKNEKVLVVSLGRNFDPVMIGKFADHGWTIEHEVPNSDDLGKYRAALENPLIKEFMDRSVTLSDEFLTDLHNEVKSIVASPDSFSKVQTYLLPLDFSDNISHEDMDRMMKEIKGE